MSGFDEYSLVRILLNNTRLTLLGFFFDTSETNGVMSQTQMETDRKGSRGWGQTFRQWNNSETVRGEGKTDAAEIKKILHRRAAFKLSLHGEDEALLLPGVVEFLGLLPPNRPRLALQCVLTDNYAQLLHLYWRKIICEEQYAVDEDTHSLLTLTLTSFCLCLWIKCCFCAAHVLYAAVI